MRATTGILEEDMGERTEYAPGTFAWVDLGTTDAEGAKAFYTAVFGWQGEDMPAGDAGTYTMFRRQGAYVSGLYQQGEEERSLGIPPHWASYVAVADADTAVARAAELGATVHGGVIDVADSGRLAIVQDPTGAVFALWQPRAHQGAGLVNAHGALSWNELATDDVDAARAFYGALFGWTIEPVDGPTPYFEIAHEGQRNGGMRPLGDEQTGTPPHWIVYFGVDSCAAGVAAAEAAGGRTVLPTMDLPIGRIAAVADPQGAVFALFEGTMDP